MEWNKDTFTISDQRDKVDLDVVAGLLSETYWGKARPRHIVEKLVASSLCFSLYKDKNQIGFARIVTDFTVFSWLSDLVIAQVGWDNGYANVSSHIQSYVRRSLCFRRPQDMIFTKSFISEDDRS